MMGRVKEIAKFIGSILIVIVSLAIIGIPYIILYNKKSKANKKMTLYPKVSFNKVENNDGIEDTSKLNEAVRLGKEALQRIKDTKPTEK